MAKVINYLTILRDGAQGEGNWIKKRREEGEVEKGERIFLQKGERRSYCDRICFSR